MRASTITSTLALVASAAAQYNVTSDPFSLILLSANSTINGTALYACHEGAAIEGLCLGDAGPSASKFHFNTSDTSQQPTGLLTYTLQGGNFEVSQAMALSYNPSSNVAVPLFGFDGPTIVAFDSSNKLYIQGYGDDSVSPIDLGASKDLYRWWACTTYRGYQYNTLAWTLGNGVPQNPTCQKVDVQRCF